MQAVVGARWVVAIIVDKRIIWAIISLSQGSILGGDGSDDGG